MNRRSKARELASQMLYLVDINPDTEALTVRGMINERLTEPEQAAFAWQLYTGTREHRDALDTRIQDVATNWKLFRMAATDRNILRLGAYELLHLDTPHRVVIDEAIELAKKFGNEQSPQFINGILDKLVPEERRESEE